MVFLGSGSLDDRPWRDRVEVRIGDVNGPKGGDDKYCRVSLQTPLGPVRSTLRFDPDTRALTIRPTTSSRAGGTSARFSRADGTGALRC